MRKLTLMIIQYLKNRARINNFKLFFLVVILIININAQDNSIKVIVNQKNRVSKISQKNLRQIFLGKIKYWPGKESIFLVVNDKNKELYTQFTNEINITPEQYSDKWLDLVISGKASPPKIVGSDAEMIKIIKNTINGIGFVEKVGDDIKGIKVVKIVKTKNK